MTEWQKKVSGFILSMTEHSAGTCVGCRLSAGCAKVQTLCSCWKAETRGACLEPGSSRKWETVDVDALRVRWLGLARGWTLLDLTGREVCKLELCFGRVAADKQSKGYRGKCHCPPPPSWHIQRPSEARNVKRSQRSQMHPT